MLFFISFFVFLRGFANRLVWFVAGINAYIYCECVSVCVYWFSWVENFYLHYFCFVCILFYFLLLSKILLKINLFQSWRLNIYHKYLRANKKDMSFCLNLVLCKSCKYCCDYQLVDMICLFFFASSGVCCIVLLVILKVSSFCFIFFN